MACPNPVKNKGIIPKDDAESAAEWRALLRRKMTQENPETVVLLIYISHSGPRPKNGVTSKLDSLLKSIPFNVYIKVKKIRHIEEIRFIDGINVPRSQLD